MRQIRTELSFPIEIMKCHQWNVPFAPKKPGDVGHDLYVDLSQRTTRTKIDRFVSWLTGSNVAVIWPFQAKLVPSGIYVNQPSSVWCQVVARSSAARKKLMVIGGIIDSGYQGELFTVLHNFSLCPRLVEHGERYSQVIFFDAIRPQFKRVYQFNNVSERGQTGFGSSGQ